MSKIPSYQISNDYLEISVSELASEWTSLVDRQTGLDYAWSGDKSWWEGRNPTLFPYVGKLNGGKFVYQGRGYEHGNHGFARHSQFSLSRLGEDFLELTLEPNKEIKQVYPFEFKLTNSYRLVGNRLHVTTKVTNRGAIIMPCTLGAHPAFACPLRKEEKFTDYRVVFAQKEKLRRRFMNPDGSWQRQLVDFGSKQEIPLSAQLFADDVLALWGVESTWVELQGPREDERVRLYREDSEQLGIWTKPGAPFVCLEPWKGFGDLEGWQGDVLTRPETYFLHEGETVQLSYTLEIGQRL